MKHMSYEEIRNAKARRHEHVLLKFVGALLILGLGSFAVPFMNPGTGMTLAILTLAPFISVAFDIYIFSDDYRICRARAELSPPANRTSDTEESEACDHPVRNFFHDQGWEHLKTEYPNRGNEWFCCAITGFVLAASCFVLWLHEIPMHRIVWFAVFVLLLDLLILGASLIARTRMAKHVVRTRQEALLSL